jgi:hypothetical protein
MTLDEKRWVVAALSFMFLGALLIVAWVEGGRQRVQPEAAPVVAGESARCYDCHAEQTPVIATQWAGSEHAQLGVGCFECHRAIESDADGFLHEGQLIATIATPKDCQSCHADIVGEFERSHHSRAAEFVGSLDNVLGEIVEGRLAAVNGCWQCHGSPVRFLETADGEVQRDSDGKPMIDPQTWPNTGIGRINLDGSQGSCSACHSRHAFTTKMARQPEVCGKCHMGPDHPQIEIYEESKHGIAFRTQIDEMNLDSDTWVLGEDYSAAPTCSTCHMSATPNQPITHDVGARISWTLRPVVSTKLENWEPKRNAMKDTCNECHAPDFVEAFYVTFDDSIEMYNDKFAIPAQNVMTALREADLLTPTPFDEEIQWTFFRLWHHEGRRARMGVSMQGPDYTQWHGFFEVAENFYTRFLPQAEEIGEGTASVEAVFEEIRAMPEHLWREGMSPEQRAEIDAFYQERYGAVPR